MGTFPALGGRMTDLVRAKSAPKCMNFSPYLPLVQVIPHPKPSFSRTPIYHGHISMSALYLASSLLPIADLAPSLILQCRMQPQPQQNSPALPSLSSHSLSFMTANCVASAGASIAAAGGCPVSSWYSGQSPHARTRSLSASFCVRLTPINPRNPTVSSLLWSYAADARRQTASHLRRLSLSSRRSSLGAPSPVSSAVASSAAPAKSISFSARSSV
mmetsp:Transcript_51008/g.101464  ORF Transcript_51008/g.101464 Transcript_51008/m.101464 type:complete len:216 (+) Transcript_51008:1-648(+)